MIYFTVKPKQGGEMQSLFQKIYDWLNHQMEWRLAAMVPRRVTPNMITVFRAVLGAPIIVLVLFDFNSSALTLFIFAGILDYVDGALARGRKEITEFGKFLDPICDKLYFLTLASALGTGLFVEQKLSFLPLVIAALCGLHVAAENWLMCIRVADFASNASGKNGKIELKAPIAGKLKTTLQLIGLGAIVLSFPRPNTPLAAIAAASLALALPFAIRSIVHKKNQRKKPQK